MFHQFTKKKFILRTSGLEEIDFRGKHPANKDLKNSRHVFDKG
jgi:hypothetical protein